MDSRVIGNVHRPGLSPTGKAGSAAGAVQRVGSLAGAEGAIAEADGQAAVLVALDLLNLPGCQRSRICSEADVKHGCGGGRRCLPAWFRCRLPRPWSERRYRCMELPRTSKTTLTRSAMGDWAGRGHGFAADRLRGFRALVHLQ